MRRAPNVSASEFSDTTIRIETMKQGVNYMACACQGKVNNTNGRCPACNEAVYHKIPTSRHSCSHGKCS